MAPKLKAAMDKLGIRNARKPSGKKQGEMLETTRKLLNAFYKPYNQALATLLNDAKYRYDG